jgi:type III polyketide synthase
MIAAITKHVPKATIGAIESMFDKICDSTHAPKDAKSFDWAIHPGGLAILKGAQQEMSLTDDHIRASLEVYRDFGNSSSPTVLIVLDTLRKKGAGRDGVVATSFGPGLLIEMIFMQRCRNNISPPKARRNWIWKSSTFRVPSIVKFLSSRLQPALVL